MAEAQVTIVDYGMGNLASIGNMFKKLGVRTGLTSDPTEVMQAERLVLPGVGAFDNGMASLKRLNLIEALEERVRRHQTPVLGICLGMQLLTERSEEGEELGLGWLKAKTVRFRFGDIHENLKIPHMGWNTVAVRTAGRAGLFEGCEPNARFYFVHSYHVVCEAEDDVLATTRYGIEFTSAVRRGNIMGVQFHPEKSHRFGMALLKRFAETEC